MTFRETETVDLKAVAQNDIKKEIIAFANCVGGTVYVGVADDGAVLGVGDPDGSRALLRMRCELATLPQ